MLGIHDLWLFIVSGLIFNVTPGPDTAYIVGRSAQFGWRGGAAAALGVRRRLSRPCVCLRRSAFRRCSPASATAFTLVKWAGAAYLCFIGVRMLLTRTSEAARAPVLRDAACGIAVKSVLAGRADQRAQSASWRCSSSPSCRNSSMPRRRTRHSRFSHCGRSSSSTARCGAWALPRLRQGPRAMSGNRAPPCAGSTTRLAGCSSISARASRCFSPGDSNIRILSQQAPLRSRANAKDYWRDIDLVELWI